MTDTNNKNDTANNETTSEESPVPSTSAAEESPLRQRAPRNGDNNGLSMVAKQYDIDGDGQLDTVEFRMREMDKKGLGHLTNEQVYGIMREQIDTAHKLFNLRRVVIVLCCVVVLLAVSNFATAWAAAILAKDTEVDSDGNMQTKSDQQPVATARSIARFHITDTEPEEVPPPARLLRKHAGKQRQERLLQSVRQYTHTPSLWQCRWMYFWSSSMIIEIDFPEACPTFPDTETIYEPGGKFQRGYEPDGWLWSATKFRYLNQDTNAVYEFDCTSGSCILQTNHKAAVDCDEVDQLVYREETKPIGEVEKIGDPL